MKAFNFILVFAIFGALPKLAASDVEVSAFKGGKDLHEDCQQDPLAALYFITGVADTISAFNASEDSNFFGICIPRDATTNDILEVTCRHLAKEPQKLHYPAATRVMSALMDEFPCPKSP